MIISIQSHVVYGYVGNKAATYPLQSLGYNVCPINTVQFSNHTGYKNWQGEAFSREHRKSLLKGIEDLGVISECKAIISGYMGGEETCIEVLEAVQRFKSQNKDILYLCDPVIGNSHCYVKPEIMEFFKTKLKADIITPNQFEAETLSDIKITNIESLKDIALYFHNKDVSVIVITGIETPSIQNNKLATFVSDKTSQHLILSHKYNFTTEFSGTGDLFSALFLGKYLKTKNALEATKSAIYLTGLAVKNSFNLESKELLVTSVDYKDNNEPIYEPEDVINLSH